MGRSQRLLGFGDCVKQFPLYHKSSEKSLKGFDQQYHMIRLHFEKMRSLAAGRKIGDKNGSGDIH